MQLPLNRFNILIYRRHQIFYNTHPEKTKYLSSGQNVKFSNREYTYFPIISEQPQNSMCQKGDIQFSTDDTQILRTTTQNLILQARDDS